MSDVAGQIVGEIVGRILAMAIEAAFRSAIASMNINIDAPATQPREEILVRFPAAIEVAAADDAKIGHECAFDQAVAAYAFNFLGVRKFHAVETRRVTSEDPRRTLHLTIVDIQDEVNGPRGTRRSITVRVDLVQDGAIVSSREFRHFSRPTKPDMCRAMDRIARPIGRDAAKWVQSELGTTTSSAR